MGKTKTHKISFSTHRLVSQSSHEAQKDIYGKNRYTYLLVGVPYTANTLRSSSGRRFFIALLFASETITMSSKRRAAAKEQEQGRQ